MSTTYTFVVNSKGPITFERLRPGSYFRIASEPSRGIARSKDMRVFWKSTSGFFATHPVTGIGVVLMPEDRVMPMRRVPFAQAQSKT